MPTELIRPDASRLTRSRERIWAISFLLTATMTVVPAIHAAPDTSGPVGTWYLNANNARLTLTIASAPQTGAYSGTLADKTEGAQQIDNIAWDPATRLLEFRQIGTGFWRWYRGTIVEGIFVGRFSSDKTSPARPEQLTAYKLHVTGWNSTDVDRAAAPRVYELLIDNKYRARLRIDAAASSPSGYSGRLKIHSTVTRGAAGEELEYDVEVTRWDGTNLTFIRRSPNWTESYDGTVSGRTISGTLAMAGTADVFRWTGYRAEVLSYGYGVRKGPNERAEWQDRTRRQLYHLMMADNPSPLAREVTTVRANLAPMLSHKLPPDRDDDPGHWPQNYRVNELRFDYTLPNPYGGPPITRTSHAYLAVPVAPLPGGTKYPALLAVNGHGGSALRMLDPDDPHYWYGDSFARQGFVVLALDISHRPVADRKAPYMSHPLYVSDLQGDDPVSGNGTHASIKAARFDSDWEEDGERIWDAMRALDYLLSLPMVDGRRVVVTGLSMGGQITTMIGGLDQRLAMSIPVAFSADLSVMLHHLNHPCWQWLNADIREYVDTADFYALTAPRPLIVETGKTDATYSGRPQPFASDKQVLRRSRVAYGGETANLLHYLHYDEHHFHVGDKNSTRATEKDLRAPEVTEPTGPWALEWQTDGRTYPLNATLFDCIKFFLRLR
jgi:hypothetical protein